MTVLDDPDIGAIASSFAPLFERADGFDASGRFPAEALTLLARTGLLAAPVPLAFGGRGLGTSAASGSLLAMTLRDLGRAWLPLSRVLEGHVNALRLIFRYGSPAQQRRAAADAAGGHLFAIWAAEIRPVRIEAGLLVGTKSFASAASVATRPVVTALSGGAEVLVVVTLPPDHQRIVSKPDLLGMRGAGTAAIELDGLAAAEVDVVGAPGDYMRQPEISLGAWRALPGLLGGLLCVTDLVATHLRTSGRGRDPTQLSRFGQMLVACETASLWVERVAIAAEADDAGEDAATLVKLARHGVDQSCTLVLDHARRAIGLASFVRPHPVERLCRDIDTYRRQPALDEVLLEAARHRLEQG